MSSSTSSPPKRKTIVFNEKKVEDPTKVPSARDFDQSTFFSPLIPLEVREFVPILHELLTGGKSCADAYKATVSFTGKLARDHDQSNDSIHFQEIEALENDLKTKGNLDEQSFFQLVLGTYTVISTIFRKKVPVSIVEKDLTAMNFPPDVIPLFLKVTKQGRTFMEDSLQTTQVSIPHLHRFKWRVDITISSSTVQKIFRPTLLVTLIDTNGNMKTFEMSVQQFHGLRYKVAKALLAMQEVERHPIIRIIRAMDAERLNKENKK